MKYTYIIAAVFLVLGGGVYFLNREDVVVPRNENMPTATSSSSSNVPPLEVQSSESLNLSNTGLTKAPEYIFKQTNLKSLDLSSNKLEGALQAEVRLLRNLRTLNLSNNKFSGVPAEVGQLRNLEVLNLSNNLITGLPHELANLSNLKFLDLSGNFYSEVDLAIIKKGLPFTTVIKTK